VTIFAVQSLALTGLGRLNEAHDVLDRAFEILEAHGHGARVMAELARGQLYAKEGNWAASRDACARGVQADPSTDGLYEYDVLACLAFAELALSDVAHAREHFEKSVARTRRLDRFEVVRARLGLARAIVGTSVARPAAETAKRDLERGRTLAREARDELQSAIASRPDLAEDLLIANRTCAELDARP
jgi:tetratricopeptide (TPR) repeat protein